MWDWPIREFSFAVSPLTYNPLRKVSRKRAAQRRKEIELTHGLLDKCGGLCEICGNPPDFRGLAKHEIIFRGRGGDATDPLNCLMACGLCHDHRKYPMTGTPLSTEQQLEIAKNRTEFP